MLIAREFIGYLSRQLVIRLAPRVIETSDTGAASELIFPGTHLAQDRPPSTAEIRRILLEHLEN